MEVKVPDIGDFADVPVIEIHVAAGDTVAAEDPLVTLESDKATMDVPSPAAGKVGELLVGVNDKVSEGSPLLVLEAEEGGEAPAADAEKTPAADSEAAAVEPKAEKKPAKPVATLPDAARQTQVLVVGSGPGGYTAAFRAADLGLDVTLVERHSTLGGVCLNVGCIPSKALLHAARVVSEADEASEFGIEFGDPKIDLDALRGWKQDVVGKLTGGLSGLAKQREVEVMTGTARFTSDHTADVDGTSVAFENCIVAAGSRAATLPGSPRTTGSATRPAPSSCLTCPSGCW